MLVLRVSTFSAVSHVHGLSLISRIPPDLVVEMLLAVLSVCSEEELEDSSDEDDTRTIADLALTPNEIGQRRQQIKNKILAMGRMQRVFQILRCAIVELLSLTCP